MWNGVRSRNPSKPWSAAAVGPDTLASDPQSTTSAATSARTDGGNSGLRYVRDADAFEDTALDSASKTTRTDPGGAELAGRDRPVLTCRDVRHPAELSRHADHSTRQVRAPSLAVGVTVLAAGGRDR